MMRYGDAQYNTIEYNTNRYIRVTRLRYSSISFDICSRSKPSKCPRLVDTPVGENAFREKQMRDNANTVRASGAGVCPGDVQQGLVRRQEISSCIRLWTVCQNLQTLSARVEARDVNRRKTQTSSTGTGGRSSKLR